MRFKGIYEAYLVTVSENLITFSNFDHFQCFQVHFEGILKGYLKANATGCGRFIHQKRGGQPQPRSGLVQFPVGQGNLSMWERARNHVELASGWARQAMI